MTILVTGAGGFLGRHVVDALHCRGHGVRALVRRQSSSAFPDGVDVVEADLRTSDRLVDVLDGVHAVVHLAARVSGSDAERFQSTVAGTERLIDAMTACGVDRLVLASSFAVYDWSAAGPTLDERTPLESDISRRDGYAMAKLWQERVCRRAAATHGFALSVVRPGFIWGPGREWVDGVGVRFGRTVVAVGPTQALPATHVVNCADLFREVVENPLAVGRTFNAVDGSGVERRRYARPFGRVVPLPYWLGHLSVRALDAVAGAAFGERRRLPNLARPACFEARFKPLHFGSDAGRVLGWQPPLGIGMVPGGARV